MAKLRVGDCVFDTELVVFDKDGLMFRSQPFWNEISRQRLERITALTDRKTGEDWARLFGVRLDGGTPVYTDPTGILAVAAPSEEIAVTAGILAERLSLTWSQALAHSRELFCQADEALDLGRALRAREGFPDIFRRLREAGLPYAVATSDTMERVEASLALFGESSPPTVIVPEMVARGKPAPDMLELISRRTGVPLRKLVMLGDSIVDVQMARNAGAIGIGIPETAEMKSAMQPYAHAITESLNSLSILEE